MKLRYAFIFTALLYCLSALSQTDKLFDPRDGKEYKVVQIGSQVWMAENLKYADTMSHLYSLVPTNEYRIASSEYGRLAGEKLPVYKQVKKDFPKYDIANIYCYDDALFSCNEYGMLYTWEAAKNACPVGWHLPSKDEFEILLLTLGGDDNKVKQTLLPGGSSGFNALLGGYLTMPEHADYFRYRDIEKIAYYWSSTTKHKKTATYMGIKKYPFFLIDEKKNACSVRCIKDSVQ